MAHEALREAHTALWASLWARVEPYEQSGQRMLDLLGRMEALVPLLPARQRWGVRLRLRTLRRDVEALPCMTMPPAPQR